LKEPETVNDSSGDTGPVEVVGEKTPTTLEPIAEKNESESKFTLVQILKNDIAFQDEKARNYFLKKEDVITLPAQYAKVLVKRGAARIIDSSI
jgi:hypothetical protein